MKKLLLSLSLVAMAYTAQAQVITSENFNGFTIGNVGTDFTGVTETNDVYTVATNGTAPTTSTNAGNDNFQIVANDAAHANVLQITGTNGDKGSRQLWIGDFTDQWSFRDAGNDILEVEFDLYTGTPGASNNQMGLYIFDATRTKYVGGFVFYTKTLVLSGLAYYAAPAPQTTGNYTFYLNTGGTNLVLTANTWVRLGVSFNKTTGQVKWKGPGLNGQVTGAAAGVDPDRVSFVSTSGTTTTPAVTNTASAVTFFDNFLVKATSTDTLLAVDEVSNATTFSVYPNPATSVINVSNKNDSPITGITIADMNGRIVKQSPFDIADVSVNIGDLSAGVYMMTITSKEGTTIKKIIKN